MANTPPAGASGDIQYDKNGSPGAYKVGGGLRVTTSGGNSFLNAVTAIQAFSSGASATVSAANTTLVCTSTTATQTISIPAAAAGNAGQDIVIKYLPSVTSVTVTPASGTIDLVSYLAFPVVSGATVAGDSMTLRSDGVSNWVII